MQGIFDIFSGGGQSGYADMQSQIQKAMDAINQNGQQGRAAFDPYNQAGQQAIPQYQQAMQDYQDPFAFMNKIGENYQQSQGATNQVNAITQAMQNAAAASGMAGTPAVQEALGQKVNDIVGADQNNYMQNIMGMRDRYLNNANNLMGYGMNAAQGINQSYQNQGRSLADLYGDMGQAKMGSSQANASGWGNLFGLGANVAGMFL